MIYSIEALRDGTAILAGDDESRLCVPVETLPEGICCGDILQQQPDGSFLPRPDITAERTQRVRTLFRKFKRSLPD